MKKRLHPQGAAEMKRGPSCGSAGNRVLGRIQKAASLNEEEGSVGARAPVLQAGEASRGIERRSKIA